MQYYSNFNLKNYNTFGIQAFAKSVYVIESKQELSEIQHILQAPHLVLGGGSNILLTQDVEIPIILLKTKGREVLQENDQHVYYRVSAGENWHEFVLYTVEKNLGAIENLSLIPGTVGAAPIQNIGAYGVEVKDSISEVRYYDIEEDVIKSIAAVDCRFGYRDSIFKHELKGKVIITDVIFKLDKHPTIRTSYGVIQQELAKIAAAPYTIQDVSQAVINIRSSKLPNPAEIGNSGSFFKNPVIDAAHFEKLLTLDAHLPYYAHGSAYKIPAAYLIEKCGWKGYKEGSYGVHAFQPLVLVNYSNATGLEILNLSERIIDSVWQQYGIQLDREVQII